MTAPLGETLARIDAALASGRQAAAVALPPAGESRRLLRRTRQHGRSLVRGLDRLSGAAQLRRLRRLHRRAADRLRRRARGLWLLRMRRGLTAILSRIWLPIMLALALAAGAVLLVAYGPALLERLRGLAAPSVFLAPDAGVTGPVAPGIGGANPETAGSALPQPEIAEPASPTTQTPTAPAPGGGDGGVDGSAGAGE